MFSDKDVFPNRAKTTSKNKQTEEAKMEERYRKLKQPIYSTIADLCISQFQLRPAPPPRGWPREFAFFFLMDGKFPGAGALKLSNARR